MASLRILTLPLTTLILALFVRILFAVVYHRRKRRNSVGFFHPYTNDGGGGERVLWCAVKAVQEESPDLDCVVYTGDHDASPETLAARAIDRFGVELIRRPKVHSVPTKCCFTLISLSNLLSFGLYWLCIALMSLNWCTIFNFHVEQKKQCCFYVWFTFEIRLIMV